MNADEFFDILFPELPNWQRIPFIQYIDLKAIMNIDTARVMTGSVLSAQRSPQGITSGASEARPTTQYEHQTREIMGTLEADLKHSDELLKELTSRLTPILAISPPAESVDSERDSNSALSPLGKSILTLNNAVRRQNSQLRALLDDLAI